MSRRFMVRQLWPSGITGRLIAIFAVAIALSIGVAELVEWHHGYHSDILELKQKDRDRIIAIATLIQTSETISNTTLRSALRSPLLELSLISQPKTSNQNLPEALTPFRRVLEKQLTLPFSLQLQQNRRQYWQDYRQGQTELWPSQRRLVMTLRDRQGQWWQLTLPLYSSEDPRFRGRQWFLILLAGLAIWIGFSWITRRMTRPILRFAAAADRLGLDVNAAPLPEQGSRELKEAAQAFNRMQGRIQQLIADRTVMLAAISHDLRTLLTRLRLRTEYIDNENQQLKAQADIAQMEAMLAATISFAKEEITPEAYTDLDLRSLIQSLCDDFADMGDQVELKDGVSPSFRGQPLALRRAFSNLIENGVIYGQAVIVSIAQKEDWVEVAIADQGPGIPIEMQEKVFQPFFRLDPSRNREMGGTGLGLSVVHTIVQRHQGEIKFRSPEAPGFVVQVNLPLSIPATIRTR